MVDCSIPQIAALQSKIYSSNPSLNVFSFGKHILIFFTVFPKKTQKQEAHLPHFRAEDVLPPYV